MEIEMSSYEPYEAESCDPEDQEVEEGNTLDEFRELVYVWTDSLLSDLWKYFGNLAACGISEEKMPRMFGTWSSMVRRFGTDKFRMVVGIEKHWNHDFYFHVFIGGIDPPRDFGHMLARKWRALGGSSAFVDIFDPSWVESYLRQLPPQARFKTFVSLPDRPLVVGFKSKSDLNRFRRRLFRH
jgi:hypothetical protein